MERVNTTGSTDAQHDAKFYLPGGSAPTAISRVEQFFTSLLRSRDELRLLVRSERR